MTIKHVMAGQPITAAGYNKLVDAVNQILTLAAVPPLMMERSANNLRLRLANDPKVKFVELMEDIHDDAGQDEEEKHERDGQGVELVKGSGPLEFMADDEAYMQLSKFGNLANVVNNGIWLEEEFVAAAEGSGKLLPIQGPGPHLAQVTSQVTAGDPPTSLGAGNVEVYKVNPAGDGLIATGHTPPVVHLEGTVIDADAWTWVRYHRQSKLWFTAQGGGGLGVERFVLTGDLGVVNESASVDITDKEGVVTDAGVTVYNLKSGINPGEWVFTGLTGAAGLVAKTKGEWVIIQMECNAP